MYLKISFNIMDLIQKNQFDNHQGLKLFMDHIDNLSNPDMNNLMNIDFAMRDHMDDTDLMLPRTCAEFPRISSGYVSRSQDQVKPWGDKSDPVYCDPHIDENMQRLNDEQYETGIWYFTGYPLTDHHEFAGVPNVWRGL